MNTHDTLEQAASWLALMSSGEATAQQHQDYERWCRQYPREAAAIGQLSGQLRGLQDQGIGGLSSRQLVGVVNTPTTRRRVLRAAGGGLGLGLLAMLVGPDALRALQPGQHWRTDTGERRQLMLGDGSQLTLDACSAVCAPQPRCLALEQGQISLRIAQGAAFRVDTAHGSLLSHQARLVLRREAHASRVSVLEGSARLFSEGQEHRLDAGQRARFDSSGLIAIEAGANADDAWTRGLLRVENQPLSQVIQALQDYRRGVIQLDASVALRRVSGVYPLDDTDRSLALLSDSLGLRLQFFSRYWVRITAA
ncbi:FecR family protein [Pseudomonas sp. 3A(2025)]